MVEARISALLPAGGGGTRLGLGDKGFLELAGKPLLHWVAEKARQVAGEVLVAVPGERLDEARALLPGCVVIAGGATRHASVARLVEAASGDRVLVHDVVCPFASVATAWFLCTMLVLLYTPLDCVSFFETCIMPSMKMIASGCSLRMASTDSLYF